MGISYTIDDYNKEMQNRGLPITALKEYTENNKKFIECRCSKCGNTFPRERKAMSNYRGCPVCKGLLVVKGYNDLATTVPWVIPYLVNADDAYLYSKNSNKEVLTKCPDCGKEQYKRISVLSSKDNHKCFCTDCRSKNITPNPRLSIDELNEKIRTDNGKIVIVKERQDDKGDYLDCKCTKCGGYFTKTRINILQNYGCPICAGLQVVKGINDIATTHPWAVQYFVNKEDAYTHTYGSSDKILVRCSCCGKIYKTTIYNFIFMRKENHDIGCKTCSPKKSAVSFDEIREKYKNKYPHLSIINYKKDNDIFTFYCHDCNCEFERNRRVTVNYHGCPICSNKKVVKGINDITVTAPWIVSNIVDKNYCYTHAANSREKTLMKCTDCGYERMASPFQFTKRQHYFCPVCDDGISYPNKYGRELLKQLPIDNWVCEYYADWTQGKFYDNYFEFEGKPFIVEMDGAIHFRDGKYTCVKDVHKNDIVKEQLCKDNNVELIRIDCQQSRPDYIKNSIINSKLSELFDLSKIDWEQCDQFASRSAIKVVCDCYNEHPTMTQKEMANYLKVPYSRIGRYLHKGAKIGLCDYDGNIAIQNKLDKLSEHFGIHIIAYDLNMNEIGSYTSISKAVKDLKEKFPKTPIHYYGIKKVLNGELHDHNGIIYKRIN